MNKYLSKAVILFFIITSAGCDKVDELVLNTDNFEIGLNEKGRFSKLLDVKNNTNYLFEDDIQSSLLSIQVNGEFELPAVGNFNEKKEIITLNYPKNNIVAEVKINRKDAYSTFELVSVTEKEKVELVVWGPFKTVIKETIGETIGVVRNSKFAIGIQTLNMRTLGGFPTNDDDSTPSFNIFGTTSLSSCRQSQ